MKTYKDIDEYILAQDESVRPRLQKIRSLIQQTAPDAIEKISYGMPAFHLHGNLVYFAAWKNHIGFYALPSGNATFQKQLEKYHTAKGSIQFPLSEPLPEKLIVDIVKFRVKENLAKVKS
ncbi:MAG TPA: DUF1801 domain-containing protein [Chitinophagaceae bacterium]|nr:DUF1801 domain-containing protein [Chitinophagaceae bacterium]